MTRSDISNAKITAFSGALLILFCTQISLAAKPLPVERVKIDSSDGVLLYADYYAVSTGRKAPVAVLLADEGESRSVFRDLASSLQDPEEGEPCAVLAVDLRGQGDSTTQRVGGQTRDLSGGKIGRRGIGSMVHIDMEAVRGFLVDKNDAGELNLNRLTYIGVGMGAVVAINAAAVDWSTPMLNTGKQGKDVKALVLVSPPWKFKGVGILDAIRQEGVQSEVAFLMLYGKDDKVSASSAEKIVKQLERARGKTPEVVDDELPDVLSIGSKSKLKGTQWLKQAGPNAEKLIVDYVQQHVVEPEFPWARRRLD